MPSRLQILTALVGTTFALPNLTPKDTSALRILPWSWNFNITALSGPGCPDFGATSPPHVTRPTFGSNTVDGSEIYYWFFAYPHLRASVGPGTPEASVWCETTLAYTELDKDGVAPAVPGYRLKLHKNGTQVIARYDLEEGVEAKLKFTYFTDGKEVSETKHYPVSTVSLQVVACGHCFLGNFVNHDVVYRQSSTPSTSPARAPPDRTTTTRP